MSKWRAALFRRMNRNAGRAMQFFRIPSERVIESGLQVQI
ncbi:MULTISPECIES: KUP/HAK/KT family potassium transporter [Pacificimonas]